MTTLIKNDKREKDKKRLLMAIKHISNMELFYCPTFEEYQKYTANKTEETPEDINTIDPLRLLYFLLRIMEGKE